MKELITSILNPAYGPLLLFIGIVLATFILEDLTCVLVSMLIVKGNVTPLFGVTACFVGIFLGDFGLWVVGRVFGARALRWKPVRDRIPDRYIDRMGRWFDRHGWSAIVASRFIPGTRFAVYVSSGMVGRNPVKFLMWTFIACLLWTPLMIFASASAGPAVLHPFEYLFGPSWAAIIAAVVVIFILLRILVLIWTREGRARIMARLSRLWRWEFWPVWVFYIPLVPWIAWLSVKYGGATVCTAANPGIPEGGVVGESKYEIMSNLPPDMTISTHLVEEADPVSRTSKVLRIMEEEGWSFPIVLKPDASQRAAGFRVIRDESAIVGYFEEVKGPVLAQPYEPGPFEAGVFYYRFPDEPRGRIFGITDKRFSKLTGDGQSTVRQLIWAGSRHRMQAKTFLARHRKILDRVLEKGEELPLAMAGNHCQGTMFKDGCWLLTPTLDDCIDRLARSFDGFYFGRFDVRYADIDEFMAGRGFKVIELNGATSEATNIYDPDHSLFFAYRTLFRQYEILYKIGAANVRRGCKVTPWKSLLRSIRSHYRSRDYSSLSD